MGKNRFFSKEALLFLVLTVAQVWFLLTFVDLKPHVGYDVFFSGDDPGYQDDIHISRAFPPQLKTHPRTIFPGKISPPPSPPRQHPHLLLFLPSNLPPPPPRGGDEGRREIARGCWVRAGGNPRE